SSHPAIRTSGCVWPALGRLWPALGRSLADDLIKEWVSMVSGVGVHGLSSCRDRRHRAAHRSQGAGTQRASWSPLSGAGAGGAAIGGAAATAVGRSSGRKFVTVAKFVGNFVPDSV